MRVTASGRSSLVGLFDVADDPAVVAARSGVAEELDTLTRRHAADETLALDIADQRRHDGLGRARCTFIGPVTSFWYSAFRPTDRGS